MLRSHKRHAVETRDTHADIQLPGNDLVVVVPALLELAARTTPAEYCAECLPMSLEERDCRRCLGRSRAGQATEDGASPQPILQRRSQRTVGPPLPGRHHIKDRSELLRGERDCSSVPDRKSTRLNSSHGYISYAV